MSETTATPPSHYMNQFFPVQLSPQVASAAVSEASAAVQTVSADCSAVQSVSADSDAPAVEAESLDADVPR